MHELVSSKRCLGLSPASWCVLLLAVVVTVVGWWQTWHLADDAFITYRYLSNVMAGHGLVWNAEPFERADGNTDFLWSMLLLAVWWLAGIEPPAIANWLALGFGVVTLYLLARAGERLPLSARCAKWRPAVMALVLLPVASNRAFLASLSSGIGQAIFNCALVAWSLTAFTDSTADAALADRTRHWRRLAALAAVVGLCRPEGHLIVAATVLLLLLWSFGSATAGAKRAGVVAVLVAVAPVLLHVTWRRLYYGSWLPCTYYAKSVDPWPEAGIKYAFTFVVEFALWVWLAVLVAWLAQRLRRGELLAPIARANLGRSAVVSVCVVHFAYYTFRIGGDLFEWRPYTHLAIFAPLTLVAMLRDLTPRPALLLGIASAAWLLALPIPWVKFAHRDGDVAPHLPTWLAPLVEPYDRDQAWLSERILCKRNHEMKTNYAVLEQRWPTREEGQKVSAEGTPVLAAEAVGIVGWVLPNVAIIDQHGLNDWVVAHTPVPTEAQRREGREGELAQLFAFFDQDHNGSIVAGEVRAWRAALSPELVGEALDKAVQEEIARRDHDGDGAISRAEFVRVEAADVVRRHAHERWPPAGYVEGFRPNVQYEQRRVTVVPRPQPLTFDEIRAHQQRFREQLGLR